VSGTCTPGSPVNCNDNDACTADTCAPATGACSHAPVVCNDGDACTVDVCVSPTGCTTAGPVNCDDSNDCTTDTCAPASGCGRGFVRSTCSDGNPCKAETRARFHALRAPTRTSQCHGSLPAGWTTADHGPGGERGGRLHDGSDSAPNRRSRTTWLVTDKLLNSVLVPTGATQVSFRNRFKPKPRFPTTTTAACSDSSTAGVRGHRDRGRLVVTGGYTGTIATNPGSPIAGRQAWSGISGGSADSRLSSPRRRTFPGGRRSASRAAWRVATDVSVSAGSIDSITFTTCSSVCRAPSSNRSRGTPSRPTSTYPGARCARPSTTSFAVTCRRSRSSAAR
jgi:hypothetical protein